MRDLLHEREQLFHHPAAAAIDLGGHEHAGGQSIAIAVGLQIKASPAPPARGMVMAA